MFYYDIAIVPTESNELFIDFTHLQLQKDAFHCCHSYVYKLRAHTSLAGILQHLPLETIRIESQENIIANHSNCGECVL